MVLGLQALLNSMKNFCHLTWDPHFCHIDNIKKMGWNLVFCQLLGYVCVSELDVARIFLWHQGQPKQNGFGDIGKVSCRRVSSSKPPWGITTTIHAY